MMISKLTALLETLSQRPDLMVALLSTTAAACLLAITLAALSSVARSPHRSPEQKKRWILAVVALPLLGASLWFRAERAPVTSRPAAQTPGPRTQLPARAGRAA